MIPVVMIHTHGRHGFVRATIKQAQKQNKVILLGGKVNQGYFSVEHHCFEDYQATADEMDSYFVQRCTQKNNLFYFKQHLYLLEFMERQGLDEVFRIDSDVMVHCDVEAEAKRLGEYTAAYAIPQKQTKVRVVAIANGYFTRRALRAFRVFLREAYAPGPDLDRMKHIWQWHVSTGHPGGVMDMTPLKMFSEIYPRVVNLSKVRDGATFDHAICTGENFFLNEYKTVAHKGWVIKEVEWREGVPYVYNLLQKCWIRFCTLHYSGGRKNMLLGEFAQCL